MAEVGAVDLSAVAEDLLVEARAGSSGRAARSLRSTVGGRLSQTLLALREGTVLAEHTAPGPATVLVVRGDVMLRSAAGEVALGTGWWAPVPEERHDLRADTDAVVLLTVAPAD